GNDDIKVFNIITNQLKSLFPENYSDSPNAPISIEIINENEFIVSESEGSKIRKYTKSGISWIASVIAGGKYGDDSFQMGIGSGLSFPEGLLALDNGDLLFTDTGNQRILKIKNNEIDLFAGSGIIGFQVDGFNKDNFNFEKPTDILQLSENV